MTDVVEMPRVSDVHKEIPQVGRQDLAKTLSRPTHPRAVASEIPHWAERWTEIQDGINSRPRMLLVVGFDGILCSMFGRPAERVLLEGTRSLLTKLVASPRVILAFVSGRPLRDIEARVWLDSAFYAGNHGTELRGPGLNTIRGLDASCRSEIVDAIAFLTKTTKRLRGVHIHDKGLALTIHGNVSDANERSVLRELIEVIARRHPRLILTAAHGVWELRPRAVWNKGSAIQQLLTHFRFSAADAIYIGDDLSDEEAFRELSDGLTFRVGIGTPTAARYRLRDPADTAGLLFCIFCALSGARIAPPDAVDSDPTS